MSFKDRKLAKALKKVNKAAKEFQKCKDKDVRAKLKAFTDAQEEYNRLERFYKQKGA